MDLEPMEAVRVTIHDGEQTVSFLARQDTALRFVAGCTVNPRSLSDLLLATEVYQRGISAWLMGALMEFDKAWQRQDKAYLQQILDPGAGPAIPSMIFQVVDKQTEAVAREPAEAGLMLISLPTQRISLAGELEVPVEGQVFVHTGERLTKRAITYILPQKWEIERLPEQTEPPGEENRLTDGG